MLDKIKRWLYCGFLPEYARQTLLEENKRLRQELDKKEQHIRELENYLDGMHDAQRAMRKIFIYNQNVRKGAD